MYMYRTPQLFIAESYRICALSEIVLEFPFLNPLLPSTAHWKCKYKVYDKYLLTGRFLFFNFAFKFKNPVIVFLIEIICKSAVLLDYLLDSASDMASL